MAGENNAFEHGDALAPLADPWTAQSWISVFSDGHRLRFFHLLDDGSELSPLIESVSAPKPSDVFMKPRRGMQDHEAFQGIEELVGRILNEAASGRILLDQLVTQLIPNTKSQKNFIEGCLRILVAQRALLAAETGQKKKKKIELRLSSDARARERRRAYAASFAHDLVVQSEQIGRLIRHGGTVGAYREELLRQLVQRHIPQRFHAATGFVDGAANQVDILIYDQLEYAPLFKAGDLVVVPPDAVRAMIEVKSELTKAELSDALRHLAEVRPPRNSGPPVFTGVFAFGGATVPTLADTIREFHRLPDDDTPIDDLINYDMIYDIGGTVDAVCILQQSIIITSFAAKRLSLSFRRDQHFVCDGFCGEADCEERTEGGVTGFAAIEAEDELVEIGLKMLIA